MGQEQSGIRRRLKIIAIFFGAAALFCILFPRVRFAFVWIGVTVLSFVTAPIRPCRSVGNLPAENIQPAMMDKSLVSQNPCGPPCWQGIIPGTSSVTEAVQILTNLPFATYLGQDKNSYDQYTMISWQNRLSVGGAAVWNGYIRILEGKVFDIRMDVAYPLTLQQVMDAHGPPDYVRVFPDIPFEYGVPPCDFVMFVWLDKGLSVALRDMIDTRQC